MSGLHKKSKKIFPTIPFGCHIQTSALAKARISLFSAVINSSRTKSPRNYFENLFAAFNLFARLEQFTFN